MSADSNRQLALPWHGEGRLAKLIAALCALATVVLTALALALPAPALAEDVPLYGHDEANPDVTYSSIDEAWDAALSGTVVVMDADWH